MQFITLPIFETLISLPNQSLQQESDLLSKSHFTELATKSISFPSKKWIEQFSTDQQTQMCNHLPPLLPEAGTQFVIQIWLFLLHFSTP